MLAVALSALLHAGWNFLLRRAGGSETVAAMGIIAEAVLLTPIVAYLLLSSGSLPSARFVPLVVVAALLALANYVALIAAYRRADLSLVYPVARGGVFLFLPLLGFLVFRERLTVTSWVAIALIVTGILMLPLARFDRNTLGALASHLRDRALLLALLAAAATAAYTVWDKYAVRELDVFLYFYGYTALLAVWFVVVLGRKPAGEVRLAFAGHWLAVTAIGALMSTSYILILLALREGVTTEVLAVRQLSIPIGVLMGWQFLREPLPAPRALGALLVTAGCVLVAWT